MSSVTVYGAYGHTGRFVVAELARRGFTPVVSGRDEHRLRALGYEARPAAVDDPAALDRALAGAAAVINCAGPFAVTAGPVVEAAVRAGIPYVDVAAEIEANVDTFARFGDRTDTTIVPAMAFFGGLGDLLATAAVGDWAGADEAHVAYGLSSWHPTNGTRVAGVVSRERRGGRRVRFTGGRLEYHDDAPRTVTWNFPEPRGVVAEFSMADVVTIPSHLAIPSVCSYLTVEAVRDLTASDTPTPGVEQTFVVDVVVRRGDAERRATATGRDIYAISAPLAVEAVERILTGRTRAVGVASAGAMFEPVDFLRALTGVTVGIDGYDPPVHTCERS
ncbi:saccharopine dehydrogenase NADP-binding domain-containing protein [Cryptosporangium japonicum]|uniref:Saccharopine dehydrogenase NADP-binding domain-containing protein n=1 Tax=Cryptosporangium japonicum TaxID=80872 RepID=A0ABN0VAI5_9ACTN